MSRSGKDRFSRVSIADSQPVEGVNRVLKSNELMPLMELLEKGNKLVEIIRKIEGTIMIEFKRNGDNTIASNRIPVFVGEFVYDEEKESFIRNGRGYWIDEETRIATREVEWKDGVEVSGRDLVDGWYTRFFTISFFLFYTNG